MSSMWRGRSAWGAFVVMGAALALRVYFVSRSYFNQDDFVAMAWVKEYDFGADYLFIEYAGHVNPGQRLLYWLVVDVAPMGWWFAALVIVAMLAASYLLMWAVLVHVGGPTPAMVLALVVYCWSPLMVMPSQWLGAVLAFLPVMIAAQVAVLLLVRERQGSGRRWLNQLGVVLAVVAGLSFHERGVLVVPVLAAVGLALPPGRARGRHATGSGSPRGWLRRVASRLWSTVTETWAMWVGLVLVVGSYVVAYLVMGVGEGGGIHPDPVENLRVVWWFAERNVVPGLLAGPWQFTIIGGAVAPHRWVSVAAGVLFLALVLRLVASRGRAALVSVAALACYVLLDAMIIVLGRGGFGAVIALDPRYSVDVLLPASLALAFTLSRPRRREPLPGRRDSTAMVAAMLAFVVSATLTTFALAPYGLNAEDRAYVETLRAGIREDPRVVLVDDYVPSDVVLTLFGKYAMASSVMSITPEQPRFDEASQRLRRIGADGRLVPVEFGIASVAQAGPDPECGYPVEDSRVVVPLEERWTGRLVVQVGFFTSERTDLRLELGSGAAAIAVDPGVREVMAVVDAGGSPGARQIVVERTDQLDGTLCLTSVVVGSPDEAR